MKLWQKEYNLDEKIEKFTVGQDRELDLELAKYDVLGSLAHTKMLHKIGLLTAKELEKVQQGLREIYETIEQKSFVIAEGVEDVHSQVEFLLTKKLGDIGKKIHAGRSRNDQVLVDLRLFFRGEIEEITQLTNGVFEVLIQKSEKHKNVLMPGYTHLQTAMVSSFGLWFGAYAEALIDDVQQLLSTYKNINQNPLGSGAGYGSSLPLDRLETTKLLGFDDLCYNSIQAQLGRGKSELFLSFSIASIAHTLGKLAMDICLFNSQNFAFLSLPNELTTGSSIMPHKKNPDVFELIRGRCGLLQALPQQVMSLTGGLPSGYHRDFQLLKEVVFPAIISLKDCLEILIYALEQIEVKDGLLENSKYLFLFTVEKVNELVLAGVPFREAYTTVGAEVESGKFTYSGTPKHTHEGSIGNLCNKEITTKMNKTINAFSFKKPQEAIKNLVRS